jgi:hypothetical protein
VTLTFTNLVALADKFLPNLIVPAAVVFAEGSIETILFARLNVVILLVEGVPEGSLTTTKISVLLTTEVDVRFEILVAAIDIFLFYIKHQVILNHH